MKYSESDFVDFYLKFKELAYLQKRLKFGESLHTPPVFSENLVKHLLRYNDWIGKEFDAKTEDNQGVEIKATTSSSGQTTIKLVQLLNKDFSHIEWIYINVNTDEFTIKKIEKISLSQFIDDKKDEERPNIILSKYSFSSSRSYKFIDKSIKEI
jgi:hypothetical protein